MLALVLAFAGCSDREDADEGAAPETTGAGTSALDSGEAPGTPAAVATASATSIPIPSSTPFLRPEAPRPPSPIQCGKELPAGFTPSVASSFSVPVRALPDRSYRVYLPELVGEGELPVVLLFHGMNGSAAGVERKSGFVDVARENGFLLVVPEGSGYPRSWYASNRVPFVVDDVVFVRSVLDQISEDFCIDESRVYAAGMSNGAFMASMLGCKMSDRIAAIAPVAGVSFPKTECGDSVPVLAIHGTNDGTVPFEHGRMFGMFSYDGARAGIAGWAGHNGCRFASDAWREGGGWTLERFGGCTDGAETALLVVDGGGHSWPKGSADYVWAFFSRHERGSTAAAR